MSKVVNVMIATAAGFVAGVLMAPKSGEQTRKDLKKKARELKFRANDVARDASEGLKTGVDSASVEAKGMAKSARTSAKVVAREAADLSAEAKSRANRVARDAKRTVSAVKKDVKAPRA